MRDGREPAFPSNDAHVHAWGMTVRDWFAGQALAGLLVRAKWDGPNDPTTIAIHSYRIADEMLKAAGE
jgi:hypothetical protein